MNPLQTLLSDLRAVEEKATPGQWFRKNGDVFVRLIPSMSQQLVAKCVLDSDMAFIAAARNSLPLLLRIIEVQGEALLKISDPKKYHHLEPDDYTQSACFMHVANEAVSTVSRLIEKGAEG